MEPTPGAEETPAPSPATPTPPDRRKWVVIGLVALLAAVMAAVSLPGLLGNPPEGTVQPILSVPGTPVVPPAPETLTTLGATGPPGFTVTVSPAETSAARGETVMYRMTIDAQNGFSGNVSMQLVASAYFGLVSQTIDLGVQEPPYPKTIVYPFPIPANWPPGITVNGVVKSTGDGIARENQLTLTVR
jgi:hypothetical protein